MFHDIIYTLKEGAHQHSMIDKQKGIISNMDKNTKKLKNLSFLSQISTQPIILDNVNKKDRKGPTGVSCQSYGKYWFNLPKGEALFKDFNSDDHLKDLKLANELVVNKLCEQINLPCADYEPAKIGEVSGVVTYNILKDNEEFLEIPGEVKSLENIQDVLLQLQNQGYNVDLDESLANAYKMILLDLLTLHIDRNSGGYKIVVNNKEKYAKFGKIMDNERCFNLPIFVTKRAFDEHIFGLFDSDKEFNVKAVVNDFEDRATGGFLKANYLKIATEFSAYQSRIQACVRFAKSNPQMKETLFSTLSNIDINLAIEQLKAENVVLNDYYQIYTNSILEFMLNQFKNEIHKQFGPEPQDS